MDSISLKRLRDYYWRWFVGALRQTGHFFDLQTAQDWLKVLGPVLIGFLVGWWIRGLSFATNQIGDWLVTVVGVGIGWGLLVFLACWITLPVEKELKHKSQVENLEKANKQLQARIEQDRKVWQEKLEPRLEIVFNQGPPFEQQDPIRDEVGNVATGCQMTYRVGIHNTSPTTAIDDVTVQLMGIEPNVISFLPVPLHRMHDNPPPGQRCETSFHLNADDTKYIDVVSAFPGVGLPQYINNFMLWFAIPTSSQYIAAGNYRLSISAHASNSPPVQKNFWIGIDSNYQYRFNPWQ